MAMLDRIILLSKGGFLVYGGPVDLVPEGMLR